MNELWLTFSVLGIVAMVLATWYDKKAGAISAMIAIPATAVLFIMETLAVQSGDWQYHNSYLIYGVPIELLVMYYSGSYFLVYGVTYISTRIRFRTTEDYAIPQAILIGFGALYAFVGFANGIYTLPYFWGVVSGAIGMGLFLGSNRKTAVFLIALISFMVEAILDSWFIQNGAYSISGWSLVTPLCFFLGALAVGSLLTQQSLCQGRNKLCVVRK